MNRIKSFIRIGPNLNLLVYLGLLSFLFPLSVYAAKPFQFEIRTPLGLSTASPSQLNEGVVEGSQVSSVATFGANFIFIATEELHPQLTGWAAGLRFDSVSAVEYADSRDQQGSRLFEDYFEVAARLFSLYAHKRWSFETFYFGPFATFGVYNPSVVIQRNGTGAYIQYEANRTRNWSTGVEIGKMFDIYLIGIELGYQNLVLEDFASSTGARYLTPSGEEKSANLSGAFANFFLGLHF